MHVAVSRNGFGARLMLAKIVILLLLACGPAIAGGRGGHNTTFDCNVWGGSCACWMSAASGKCGNATAHYSNAICAGGDDGAALADWISYAHGLGSTRAVLFISPGCVEGVWQGGSQNASFTADNSIHCAGYGSQPDTTIQNAVIWGYGTTFNQIWFGAQGLFGATSPDGVESGCAGTGLTNVSPLIQTASAGATTIFAVTSGAFANFSVGDQIVVTAIGLFGCGSNPQTPQIFEFKSIIAVNHSTDAITLNEGLKNNYKSTYPILTSGGVTCSQPYDGGAAAINLLEKTWAGVSQYYGMTVLDNSAINIFEPNITGRSISLIDVVSLTGGAPTQSGSIYLIGGWFSGLEVDKVVDLFVVQGTALGGVNVFSSSINSMVVQNSNFKFLTGTPLNAAISNTQIGAMRTGPLASGAAQSLTLDKVTITPGFDLESTHFSNIAPYSFSGGALTIAKTNSEWTSGKGQGLWVPGHKYYMGDFDGSNSCATPNTFTVTDIVDVGANVQINTDIVSIPTGLTCGGGTRAPNTFGQYLLQTFIQRFSGPYFQWPETIPP